MQLGVIGTLGAQALQYGMTLMRLEVPLMTYAT